MNDTINSVNINHAKSRATDMLSSANSSHDGRNGVDAGSSSASENSFQDSIQKAYDDSVKEPETTETESAGNDLPESGNLADAAAEDDRLLCLAEFNSQLNSCGKFTDQQIKNAANAANGLNILSSQAKLVKSGLTVNGENDRLTASNITVAKNTTAKSVTQQPDIYQLNAEQIALPGHKAQLLMTAIQQQQLLPGNQLSLLSQVVPAQAESGINSLHSSLNSPLNSLTTLNPQSIAQPEIVETFGRPPWSQGLGKQILWMVNQNISSAELRLNPAHLGPIELLIDMSDDQVNVSLSSRHAVVREAMEQALPKLREMLDANGLNLAETDISQHSFAERHEQNAQNHNTGVIGDSTDQPVSSEINERLIKHTSALTTVVDYYI